MAARLFHRVLRTALSQRVNSFSAQQPERHLQGHTKNCSNRYSARTAGSSAAVAALDRPQHRQRESETDLQSRLRQSPSLPDPNPLTDTFARKHTYLRISLTERCNLRCSYCMPAEGVPLTALPALLTADEIVRLASLFVAAGVTKIRLTGGEPLVRPDLPSIAHRLGHLPGVDILAITTNALVLKRTIPALVAARVSNINISLDTLVAPKFELITRRRGHSAVLAGLQAALDADFKSVKLNCVVMKGINDDELADFCNLTRDYRVDVRFIEFMPFDGNHWSDDRFLSYADMLEIIGGHFGALERATDSANDTCKHFRIPGHKGRIGFITSMTNHFCGSCNRLRITADGNIKVCLFGSDELSLRDAMRAGATDEQLAGLIGQAVKGKHFALGGNRDMYEINKNVKRGMSLIGG
jgi:molybdenum cofactor biosynthesis protein A